MIPNDIYIFAGPTLSRMDVAMYCDSSIHLRKPVRRGDIEKLIENNLPTNVAIVDGTFHSYPAVGHAELLCAIKLGWKVWGLSSMGAIRAAEMNSLGMRGYGAVYESFVENMLDDDEVALLHQDSYPYRAFSEPLIHIRAMLTDLVGKGLINKADEIDILFDLKNCWYGHRTIKTVAGNLKRHGLMEKDIREIIDGFDRFRIKDIDLKNFLRQKEWKNDE